MTQNFYTLWAEARTRFSNQLKTINATDLTKKLGNSPNSAGFLIRHMAEVELLFAKNVFKLADVKVNAKTLIAQHDTGEWIDLSELMALQNYSCDCLQKAILAQENDSWTDHITTAELALKPKQKPWGALYHILHIMQGSLQLY